MSLAIRMKFEPMRTLGFAAIGPAFMGIGTGLAHPITQFLVQNLTDTSLIFSWDGVNDHFELPKSGYWVEDITANKTNTHGYFIAEGDRLYVRQDLVAPTTGKVCFTVMYGSE
jgi:hypothetical protein